MLIKTKIVFIKSKKSNYLIIKEEDLKVSIDDMEYFDNKALYQFTIPTNQKPKRQLVTTDTTSLLPYFMIFEHLPFPPS